MNGVSILCALFALSCTEERPSCQDSVAPLSASSGTTCPAGSKVTVENVGEAHYVFCRCAPKDMAAPTPKDMARPRDMSSPFNSVVR